MFYAFATTVTDADVVSAKREVPLHLTAGVIHQVDVLFQDGCDHLVEVQIFKANHQLWPSNRGSVMKGNATVISFREFLELGPGGAELTAKIWGDGVVTGKDVIIQIGLLSKKILQPLSFDELLTAATGTG